MHIGVACSINTFALFHPFPATFYIFERKFYTSPLEMLVENFQKKKNVVGKLVAILESSKFSDLSYVS